MIRIWRGDEWYSDFKISYYDLSVIYQEQCEIAEKEALAARKAAAEDAIRESKKQERNKSRKLIRTIQKSEL